MDPQEIENVLDVLSEQEPPSRGEPWPDPRKRAVPRKTFKSKKFDYSAQIYHGKTIPGTSEILKAPGEHWAAEIRAENLRKPELGKVFAAFSDPRKWHGGKHWPGTVNHLGWVGGTVEEAANRASVPLSEIEGEGASEIVAIEPGTSGNHLILSIKRAGKGLFDAALFYDNQEIESYGAIGLDPEQSNFIVTALNKSQYIRLNGVPSSIKQNRYQLQGGTDSALYVFELQSDAMQQSWHLFTPEKWQALQQKRMDKLTADFEAVQAIFDKFEDDPEALKNSLPEEYKDVSPDEIVTRINDRIEDVKKNMAKTPEYGHLNFLKNNLEQWYDNWISEFYNVVIDTAKAYGVKFIAVATAEYVAEIWGKDEVPFLFKRIYDKYAERLGLQFHPKMLQSPDAATKERAAKFRVGTVSRLKYLESVIDKVADMLSEQEEEDIWISQFDTWWKIHFDTFMKNMAKATLEKKVQDITSADIREMFPFWIDAAKEVRPDLISDSAFQSKVNVYVKQKYETNVSDLWPEDFGGEEEEPTELPPSEPDIADQIQNWLSTQGD